MKGLQVEKVVYTYQTKYQSVHALNGVDAEFLPGHMYAIVGASGSGKTTLLSLLAGLDVPTGGDIFWEGVSISKLDRDKYRREHVSVIYQNFNLFPYLTVLENTAYPLYMRKVPGREADEIAREKLRSVGISKEQFLRMPSMLSGGEQQRVAIARALSAGSEIVLADEPTGNLDSENGENIVDVLKRLSYEEERCVIVVTHDLVVAEAADVTLQIKDGRIVEDER